MSTNITTAEKATGEVARAERTYQTTFVPRFDIYEGDEEMILYGDLPGVSPEDVDVRFENKELTIHGKVCPRYQGIDLLYGEYGIGDYHRSFTIGEAIDASRISAEMHNGVLTVHLPKSEDVKPRRIDVKAK
ncbi:MAG: Hsp20/alpha crystallin family protein [Planctomycetota bacterium]|nr:MAG: Hsp20/alpha crystallin family protein [Planctomycetota bacterium]